MKQDKQSSAVKMLALDNELKKFRIKELEQQVAELQAQIAASPVAQPQDEREAEGLLRALQAAYRLLDGSQPMDIPGARMVLQSAISGKSALWSYDLSPPPGFIDYVKRNYTGDVHFHDPEWHALRLWNAAMKNAKPPFVSATPSQDAVDGYYLASFKRGNKGIVTWWGPNNAGYTTYLNHAGIYHKEEIEAGYHDSEYTVPVPVSFVRQFEQRVVDSGMSVCEQIFWNAKSLRASIAAMQAQGAKE